MSYYIILDKSVGIASADSWLQWFVRLVSD